MNNLGRLVKWQEKDGGWHTGREVLTPKEAIESGGNVQALKVREDYSVDPYVLVQESCTYQLSWVLSALLTEWETREQRAAKGQE